MIDERRIHGSGETVHTAEEMRLTTENSRLREALERGWQLVVLLRHAAGIHGSAPPSHLLVPLIRLFDWDTELANDELFRDLGHRALASPPPTPVTGALNQCDGCVAGMPVKDGRHTFPEGSWSGMRCTKDRYQPAPTPVVGTGPADITEDLNIIADLIQQELSPVSHVAAAGRLRYAADLIRILRGNFTSGLDNLSDPR